MQHACAGSQRALSDTPHRDDERQMFTGLPSQLRIEIATQAIGWFDLTGGAREKNFDRCLIFGRKSSDPAFCMGLGMASETVTNSFLQRLIGAAALDAAIYEEVEADPAAMGQALVVVVLSSLAAGFGASGLGGASIANIGFISIVALIAWAAWALITFEIGARLMPQPQTRVDVGQLMRTIGFAATPGLLRVLGAIPGVTIPAFAISTIWMLAAMIVAVRQALDYTSTARAVAVCLLGWLLAGTIAVGLGLMFGPTLS
jgi:hypothetical protein